MGQLEVSCFAQGANNTLYALSFGYDLPVKTGDNTVAALLKSNASPSSPNVLTWQVVSTIRKSELFSFIDNFNLQCSVDPNGAFLAWSYDAYALGAALGAQSHPGGFRYDPALSTSSATTTGKGGWANIDTPLKYTWTSSSAGGDLFYLKDSANYNFYHAYMPGTVGVLLNVGVLNTAVTPNMRESSATAGLSQLHDQSYQLYVWDGSKALSPVGMSQLPLKDQYTSSVTGMFGNSSTTYMLVQSGRLPSQYDSAGTYTLKALVLSSASAGTVLDVPNNITVPDNLTYYTTQGESGGENRV
ncbi:hypothetical protein EDD11_008365 [Mortierella claussenii]|nr:hypothetical protein EDD11_008365 [Mortierella claussenii]